MSMFGKDFRIIIRLYLIKNTLLAILPTLTLIIGSL
jgi:hypothetical protein